MNQQVRLIKPQLGFHKTIEDLYSLRQFSKKNFKSLFTFTIVKPSTANIQKLKFHKLKRSLSSFKCVKHLDLSSFVFPNFNIPQLNLFIKKFYKVQRFSGTRNNSTLYFKQRKESLRPSILILKNAKFLRHLSLEISFNFLSKRFLRLMRLCKIRVLQLTQLDYTDIEVNLSKYLPSTLEKLSIFSDSEDYDDSWVEFGQYPFSLLNLKNLQKLEIKFTLALNDLRNVLKTISDPFKLKTLKIDITKEREGDRSEISNEIAEFLRRCSNLEELEIRTRELSVMDFYFEIANMKLKELKIYHKIFWMNNDDFSKIGEIVRSQKDSLRNLSLIIRFGHIKPGNLERLLEDIKVMNGVKKLQFKLVPSTKQKNSSAAALLAEAVEAFDCLEELNFEEAPADKKNSKEDFEKLCQALLKKHSKSLKSLKLSCQDQAEILMQTLKRLPKLEHLSLLNLDTKDSNFYDDLRDIVCERNKGLNSVKVVEMRRSHRKEQKENFSRMLHDIICKSTMRYFCYSEAPGMLAGLEFFNFNGSGTVGPFLHLPKILKQIYHFDFLQIPNYTCGPDNDLDILTLEKWENI